MPYFLLILVLGIFFSFQHKDIVFFFFLVLSNLFQHKHNLWAVRQCHLPYHFIFPLVFLHMTASVTYGSSQARGRIGAAAVACATATPMPDLSCICDLCWSLWQCWILNTLSEARDIFFFFYISFFFPVFSELYPWQREVPRLGIQSEM